MSEKLQKGFLYVAGGWNIIGGASALVDPAKHLELYKGTLSLGEPVQAFFFRATMINVMAWGLGYILAARHPLARAPILIAGGIGKLAYFGACLTLYMNGGNRMLLAFGILDVVFAGAFFYIAFRLLRSTARA